MEAKTYSFDEAILEPGLYRAPSGSYIFVTRNSHVMHPEKPCHNGVIFIYRDVLDTDKNLSDLEKENRVQRCNSVQGQTFIKLKGALDFRLIMNPDKVVEED